MERVMSVGKHSPKGYDLGSTGRQYQMRLRSIHDPVEQIGKVNRFGPRFRVDEKVLDLVVFCVISRMTTNP